MKRRRRSKRMGQLMFLIPVAAIAAIAVIGLITYITLPQTGTLVVEAVSSSRYSPSLPLGVPATVGATTLDTPFNLTLKQGSYAVEFGTVTWYAAPSPRSVDLAGGKTAYAIGTYVPILKVVAIVSGGFNSTSVNALHAATPVVWVNDGTAAVTLVVEGAGSFHIPPSSNYTHVFTSQGTFAFYLYSTTSVEAYGYVHSL